MLPLLYLIIYTGKIQQILNKSFTMPLFKINNKNILFIHIPKTGGTTIASWLATAAENGTNLYSTTTPTFLKSVPQHLTYANIQLLLGDFYTFDHVFTIVRNPYDRLESEYFYETEKFITICFQRPDFSTWSIKQITSYQADSHHLDNHFRLQTDFLDEAVSIFKLEGGLHTVMRQLNEKFGIPVPQDMTPKNSSARMPVRWSAELLNTFNKVYDDDFTYLGYEKRHLQLRFASQ